MAKPSIERSHRPAAGFGAISIKPEDITANTLNDLAAIGIEIPQHTLRSMLGAYGFDANDVGISPTSPGMITSPSIAVPVQFLQAWLPGFVRTITAARKIDQLIGLSTTGAWEDEEVVQGVMELIGGARLYSDHGNVPTASWNANWERRTIVRMELGMEVGLLEDARTARIRVNTGAEKRAGTALALDIQRNRIGFYGYNGGANRTYGFLNDPSLSAYTTVANGAGGSPLWSNKTMEEIARDIRVALAALRTASQDTIDPEKDSIVLAIATNRVDFLSTMNALGLSVRAWLRDTYPNVRVESAPELNDASGGAAVFYLYAESVNDGASDDSRAWVQVVPAKFMALGVEKRIKSYAEGYANATAGVMLKRPYAVRRYAGI